MAAVVGASLRFANACIGRFAASLSPAALKLTVSARPLLFTVIPRLPVATHVACKLACYMLDAAGHGSTTLDMTQTRHSNVNPHPPCFDLEPDPRRTLDARRQCARHGPFFFFFGIKPYEGRHCTTLVKPYKVPTSLVTSSGMPLSK